MSTLDSNFQNYTSWDKNHTTSCLCDIGFTGAACEIRMCPKGFDPFSGFLNYRTIQILISSNGLTLSDYLKFKFNGYSFSMPANGNQWTSAKCENAFESLPNINEVKCTQGIISALGETNYTIEFLKFPIIPYENNIFSNNGNPILSNFQCDISTTDTNTLCTLIDGYNSIVPG